MGNTGNEKQEKVGLDCLDDSVLADIVEAAREDSPGPLTGAAGAALAELCKRSGYQL